VLWDKKICKNNTSCAKIGFRHIFLEAMQENLDFEESPPNHLIFSLHYQINLFGKVCNPCNNYDFEQIFYQNNGSTQSFETRQN
jgi:hypothetical protein